MSNRNYKVGYNRYQVVLLTPCIDDYVSETNPIRAIDAYVESLSLMDLNLQNSSGLTAGQLVTRKAEPIYRVPPLGGRVRCRMISPVLVRLFLR